MIDNLQLQSSLKRCSYMFISTTSNKMLYLRKTFAQPSCGFGKDEALQRLASALGSLYMMQSTKLSVLKQLFVELIISHSGHLSHHNHLIFAGYSCAS